MAVDEPSLEETIETLLADARYRGHPAREALARLWAESRQQAERLERIIQISDGYQSMARDSALTLTDKFNKRARQIEKAIRISDRYQRMMREVNQTLKEASFSDHLTGLANRRMVMERLREETVRAQRLGQVFSVAVLDIDHFKQVNDLHGHVAGDHVLVEVARAMEAGIREYDLCGRWGGEEFILLLPETELATAVQVSSRVLEGIRQLSVPIGEASVVLTISIGVVEYHDGESFSDTVNRADVALLEAKRTGRDRLIAA